MIDARVLLLLSLCLVLGNCSKPEQPPAPPPIEKVQDRVPQKIEEPVPQTIVEPGVVTPIAKPAPKPKARPKKSSKPRPPNYGKL